MIRTDSEYINQRQNITLNKTGELTDSQKFSIGFSAYFKVKSGETLSQLENKCLDYFNASCRKGFNGRVYNPEEKEFIKRIYKNMEEK